MPSTTSGRLARIARALCQKATSSLSGNGNTATGPLPRTPENLTASISYPRPATSDASIPVADPSQTTRQPEARKASATARPGNTWPPVPPAAIMTVLGTVISLRASCAHPPHDLAVLPVDPQQDRERDAVREQPASPEAHERKREALGGQHAHVHAHVDEHLHAEPHAYPLRHERGVGTLQRHGLAPDGEGAHHEPGEQRDHGEHPCEPQLLADHREQEVGVRLGQVEQLLDSRPEPHSEPLAAPERDERVRQLVAAAERVGPGIHEPEDALHAIGR